MHSFKKKGLEEKESFMDLKSRNNIRKYSWRMEKGVYIVRLK
jgi:hypothetical protein